MTSFTVSVAVTIECSQIICISLVFITLRVNSGNSHPLYIRFN